MSLIKKMLSKLSSSIDDFLTQQIESKIKEHLDKNILAINSEKTGNIADLKPNNLPTVLSAYRVIFLQLNSIIKDLSSYSKTLTDETKKQKLNSALDKATQNYDIISSKIINSIVTDDDMLLFLLVVLLTLLNILEFIDYTFIMNSGTIFYINQIFDNMILLSELVIKEITYENNKMPVTLIILALASEAVGINFYDKVGGSESDDYTKKDGVITGITIKTPKMFQLILDISLKASKFASEISNSTYVNVQNANVNDNEEETSDVNPKTPFDAQLFYYSNLTNVKDLIDAWIIEVNNAIDATKVAKAANDTVNEANKAYEACKTASKTIKDALKESTDSKNNELASVLVNVYDDNIKLAEIKSVLQTNKSLASNANTEAEISANIVKTMTNELEKVRKYTIEVSKAAVDAAASGDANAKDKLDTALDAAKKLLSESNKVSIAVNKANADAAKYKALNAIVNNANSISQNFSVDTIITTLNFMNLIGLEDIAKQTNSLRDDGYSLALKTAVSVNDIEGYVNSVDKKISESFLDITKSLDETIAKSENIVSSANAIFNIVSNSATISEQSDIVKELSNKLSEINKNADNSTSIVNKGNGISTSFTKNIENEVTNPALVIYKKTISDFKQVTPNASEADAKAAGVDAVRKFIAEKYMPQSFKDADAAVESAKKALDNAKLAADAASNYASEASSNANANKTNVITNVHTNSIAYYPIIDTFVNDIVKAASTSTPDIIEAINKAINIYNKGKSSDMDLGNNIPSLAMQGLLLAGHILLSNSTSISDKLKLNL